MGGICGIFRRDGQTLAPDLLVSMAEAARHRGPDGIRFWHGSAIGLAHLAMWIDPRRETPLQPTQVGNLTLVCSARLDNRDDLVPTLRAHGVTPASSDAEVILAAYQRWGTECAAHLIGDFAFAIWDEAEQHLFAARDPMAMRPFYYHYDSKRFMFASEIGQLLAAGAPKALDEVTAAVYLTSPLGQHDWTFFTGIRKLPPAHALLATAQAIRLWRYWDIDPEHRIRYRRDEDYAERFRELFTLAVRDRLLGQAPLSIALSGGVDSSAVAAVAASLGAGKLRAYSWAFTDPAFAESDERVPAELLGSHYGFPLHPIFGDDAWPLAHLDSHGPDLDSPLIWYTQTLNDRIYEATQQGGSRLLLTGDRGDELVGDWIYDYPGWLFAGGFTGIWRDWRAHRRTTGDSYLSLAKRYLFKPLLAPYLTRPQLSPAPWVNADLIRRTNLPDLLAAGVKEHWHLTPRQARRARIFGIAVTELLACNERRMAQRGLCFAAPWSDRRLAEFVLAIPQWQVQSLSQAKRIAKLALGNLMPLRPQEHLGQPTLNAFFDRALRDRTREVALDLTHNSRAAAIGLVNAQALREQYDAYVSGKHLTHDLWFPLTLELWLRRYWS